jgi:hypothetical protein
MSGTFIQIMAPALQVMQHQAVHDAVNDNQRSAWTLSCTPKDTHCQSNNLYYTSETSCCCKQTMCGTTYRITLANLANVAQHTPTDTCRPLQACHVWNTACRQSLWFYTAHTLLHCILPQAQAPRIRLLNMCYCAVTPGCLHTILGGRYGSNSTSPA